MQESSLAKITQTDVKLELDDMPTLEEIKKATMQLKVGKSPGIDGIPADVYQNGGDAVLQKPQDMFTYCREKRDCTTGLHCLSVQNQGRKIKLFKLPRHHSAPHCRQNFGSHLAE